MARTAKTDIESRWYDVFSAWARADREIALRVLTELHKRLPEPKERGKKEVTADDAADPKKNAAIRAEPQGSLLKS
jgi:hypothetical protein